MQQARFLIRIVMLVAAATWFAGCSSSGDSSAPANPPVFDATLSALTFSGGDLDQIFQSSLTDYTATVNFLQTSVTVNATASDAAATITINGTMVASGADSPAIALADGANTITIVVTASDGVTTETYTLTVTKQAAASFAQQAYLKASNAQGDDAFGFSVAVDGDTLVVGAPFEENEPDAGAAYVFVRSGSSWTQQALLKADNAATLDRFGTSVAISGETVAVGATGRSLDAGAAYVFVRSGTSWSQQQLAAIGAVPGDDLGTSIAVDGDTLVVGARGVSNGAGAAYVFTRSGAIWSEQQALTASDGADGDQFGLSVALDGNTVVVGAPSKNSSGADAGNVYVFQRSGPNWNEQQILTASDAEPNDNFGFGVAIEGDTVVVGAPQEDTVAGNAGAAYVFTRTGVSWAEQTILTASNAAAGDFFGSSVAISAEGIAVGADTKDNGAGAGYVFTGGGASWSEQAILTASNADAGDQFGGSLAISGGTVVVGAPQEDSSATGGETDDSQLEAGAAYVWE